MYVKRLKDDEILQIMRVISDPDCEIVSRRFPNLPPAA